MGVTQLPPNVNNPSHASDYTSTGNHPFPGRGVEKHRKPRQDMAFLIIAPSIAIGCERMFSLTAVWAYPHQACFQTLPEAAPGALPSTERTEDPLGQKETDSAIPALAATFTQTPHRGPYQVTSLALPTSFPNYSSWLYHRHWRQWASPLSPSTGPLL